MTRSRDVAARYDVIWSRFDQQYADDRPWHFESIAHLLPLELIRGRVLELGCGSGRDAAYLGRLGCDVVAVDLSDEAVRAAVRRAQRLAAFHVVQADLQELPLADRSFDVVYSYGALHHLGSPERGLAEALRVLRPGGLAVAYVYEDLTERSAVERKLLSAVKRIRCVTTKMPPRLVYGLCTALAPPAWALLTVPAHILNRWGATSVIARRIPLRYGTGPLAVRGDLYDRFATPIEFRYSRRAVERWFGGAGLTDVQVFYRDGWVAVGQAPGG